MRKDPPGRWWTALRTVDHPFPVLPSIVLTTLVPGIVPTLLDAGHALRRSGRLARGRLPR